MPTHRNRLIPFPVLLLLLAAGCSAAPGVPAPPGGPASASAPAPAGAAEPKPGQCFQRPIATAVMGLTTIDCAQPHQSELAAVGHLDAAVSAPPPAGSPDLAAADGQCRTKVAQYAGVPLGRRGITYELALPPGADWEAGARWFACELVIAEAQSVQTLATVPGSHAAGQNPLGPHCFTMSHPADLQSLADAPCDKPHSAEFVAAVTIDYGGAPPTDDKTSEPYMAPCRDEVAAQSGVAGATVESRGDYTVAYSVANTSTSVWRATTPVAMCFFVLGGGRTMRGSILRTK